jgi:peptidoglycan hydrolase CwlO-like protein
MKKKFFTSALIILIINVGFVFSIDSSDLEKSLNKGVAASNGAISILRRINNIADYESKSSDLFSHINTAEDAILDSINYQETSGKALISYHQQLVNQIKANLRQVKSKLASFGLTLSLGFEL